MSGESKSMIHSICRIQMMVNITNKMWETGKVWIALVQFQKSFLNFISAIILNKIQIILVKFIDISSDFYMSYYETKLLMLNIIFYWFYAWNIYIRCRPEPKKTTQKKQLTRIRGWGHFIKCSFFLQFIKNRQFIVINI